MAILGFRVFALASVLLNRSNRTSSKITPRFPQEVVVIGKKNEPKTKTQQGFVTRLRAKLNRGKSWLTYDFATSTPSGKVDEDALEDLETDLVMADVGVGGEYAIDPREGFRGREAVEFAQLGGKVRRAIEEPALPGPGVDNSDRHRMAAFPGVGPRVGTTLLPASGLRIAGVLGDSQDHEEGRLPGSGFFFIHRPGTKHRKEGCCQEENRNKDREVQSCPAHVPILSGAGGSERENRLRGERVSPHGLEALHHDVL